MSPAKSAILTFASGLIALTLFLTSLAASAQPFGEDRRYFKDWLAACRPTTHYCSATTYVNPNSGNGTVADYILRVGRHSDPGAKWEISLTVIAGVLDANRPLGVQVFGMASQAFYPETSYGPFGASNDFFLLGGKAQTLFNDMIAGQAVRFSYLDVAAQPFDATFSLAGLSASLLWIDETQDKLGSPRIAGNKPLAAQSVTPPNKQQAIANNGFPARLIAKHEAEQNDCEIISNGDMSLDNGQIAALSDTTTLFIVPCFLAAYNAGFRIYIADTGEIGGYRTQYFAFPSTNGTWAATDILIGANYDADAQILATYAKSRGLGDCGNAAQYRWNDWEFELIEYREKSVCDERYSEFPIIFQAPR